jgi:integrase/recombinase XerD
MHDTPDLAELLPSWGMHLRAERKSPQTVESYLIGARLFLAWCADAGCPAVLDRPTVNAFVAGLLASGAEAATARARHQALRRFSAWLAAEEETERDALIGLKPPKLDVKVVPRLTEDQCRALVKACAGREFVDRRDEALVRFMLETGVRAGEVIAMGLTDMDAVAGAAVIRRGKGGKGRVVPFGPQTGRAVDRYLRLRRAHRLAADSALWLGGGCQRFAYHGLRVALGRRAELAGIEGFTPHVLRHTAASRWLSAGGSEGGLMAVAGWSRRDMLDRYVADTASERATQEARHLGLGDL